MSPLAQQWFDLEETSTGKLHLKLEWLSLLSTPEKLEQVRRRHRRCANTTRRSSWPPRMRIPPGLLLPPSPTQVLRSVRADRSLANDGLSSALLVVYLDSAQNLPVRTRHIRIRIAALGNLRLFLFSPP